MCWRIICIHRYYVNERNRKKRLEFAQSYVKTPMKFGIESSSRMRANLTFLALVDTSQWRKKNEEYKSQNLQPTIKHGGGSICVWGCMSVAGVGGLIDGTMDHKMYINISKTHLRSNAEKMGIENNFVFMQNNDPKHTA